MSQNLNRSIADPQPGEPAPMSAPDVTLRQKADALVESARETSRRLGDDYQPPAAVTCACGHVIFDGEAIRARCVKPAEGIALCRCKRWVGVPVQPVQ